MITFYFYCGIGDMSYNCYLSRNTPEAELDPNEAEPEYRFVCTVTTIDELYNAMTSCDFDDEYINNFIEFDLSHMEYNTLTERGQQNKQ